MCIEALWIQEIKPMFNSMKTLIIVLEFAMVFTSNGNKIKQEAHGPHRLPEKPWPI
jgi:hypothetical protein